MPRIAVSWNPAGLQRLSFKKLQLFPVSPRRQLGAGLLSMVLVILGSLGASLLPIPNLNLFLCAIIGFFLAERVHPHPLIGPAVVSLAITGVCWSLIILVQDPLFDFPPEVMLSLSLNLFATLSVGALLSTVVKMTFSH